MFILCYLLESINFIYLLNNNKSNNSKWGFVRFLTFTLCSVVVYSAIFIYSIKIFDLPDIELYLGCLTIVLIMVVALYLNLLLTFLHLSNTNFKYINKSFSIEFFGIVSLFISLVTLLLSKHSAYYFIYSLFFAYLSFILLSIINICSLKEAIKPLNSNEFMLIRTLTDLKPLFIWSDYTSSQVKTLTIKPYICICFNPNYKTWGRIGIFIDCNEKGIYFKQSVTFKRKRPLIIYDAIRSINEATGKVFNQYTKDELELVKILTY